MTAEGQCFPKTVDDLKPVLEIATEFPLHHLDLQPDVRPRRLDDCLPLLEGWMRLAEQVDFPVYIETHRDRMTTDLYFTLDILEPCRTCRSSPTSRTSSSAASSPTRCRRRTTP